MTSTASLTRGWYIARRKDEEGALWRCVYFDGTHVFTTAKFQNDFLPKYFEFYGRIEMPKER